MPIIWNTFGFCGISSILGFFILARSNQFFLFGIWGVGTFWLCYYYLSWLYGNSLRDRKLKKEIVNSIIIVFALTLIKKILLGRSQEIDLSLHFFAFAPILLLSTGLITGNVSNKNIGLSICACFLPFIYYIFASPIQYGHSPYVLQGLVNTIIFCILIVPLILFLRTKKIKEVYPTTIKRFCSLIMTIVGGIFFMGYIVLF